MKLILNIVGIFVVLFLMWLLSYRRKQVKLSIVIKGIIVELILALILIKVPAGKMVISVLSDGVSKVLSYANDGITFMFGSLNDPGAPTGYIMAIQTLTVIIFISAIFSVLYYWGVLNFIIKYVGLVPFGSIMISKILLPQTEEVKEIEDIQIDNKGDNENVLSALSEGGSTGLKVAVSIAASLMVMVSVVAMINGILGLFGVTLQEILGTVFAPLGALMGLEGEYVREAGQLLGSKLILNEFVAFADLGTMIKSMDYRSGLVMTVALSGFANMGSMGVCVSAIGALCEEKRPVLARLAPRAMLGGFAVSVLSSMIVGIITLF